MAMFKNHMVAIFSPETTVSQRMILIYFNNLTFGIPLESVSDLHIRSVSHLWDPPKEI